MSAQTVLFVFGLFFLPLLLCIAVRLDLGKVALKTHPPARSTDWIDVESANVQNDPCYQYSWIAYQHTWTCGEGFCQCTHTVADCSQHGDNLNYIPQVPASVTHLDFAANFFLSIDRDFFANVTNITHLDLSQCRLETFGPKAFDLLTKLTYLMLSGNMFTYETLAPAFSVERLRYLDISHNDLGEMPEDVFKNNTLDQLDTLCLSFNDMKTVRMTAFMQLTKLRHLDLCFNSISSQTLVVNDAYLPQLIYLNLKFNSFAFFFETCRVSSSVFPNLTTLLLSNSLVGSLHKMFNTCLPSLQNLDLSENIIQYYKPNLFHQMYFPSLRRLNVSPSAGTMKSMDKCAFGNAGLQELYIMDSIDFSSPTIDVDTLACCPNLSLLALDRNDFSNVGDDRFNRLLRSVPRLIHLRMAFCDLGHVTGAMFLGLKQLRILNFEANKLSSIPDGAFDGLESLSVLILTQNLIPIIKETTFNSFTLQNLAVLDLSKNPFFCSCDLTWFQWWITTNGDIILNGQYLCDNVLNKTVQDFFIEEQSCLLGPAVSKFIIVTIVMVLFVFFTFTSLYRYRWHLRLVLYEVFRGPEERWRRLQRFRQPFDYDVFLSYDSEDLDWVRVHLMPEVEGRMGLKLCVLERDFIPGKQIMDNIADSVKASKKVMMLFSANFAKSHWCQFELAMCLSHVMENGDALLVVLLHNMETRDLTPAMMAVMKSMTYIVWGDEPEAQALFWRRIQIALHEIIPAV